MFFPILIIILLDLYAFQAVRTVFVQGTLIQHPATWVYWVISLVVYILIAYGAARYFGLSPMQKRILLGVVISLGVAKLSMVFFVFTDDAIRLVRYIGTWFSNSGDPIAEGSRAISRSEFLNRAALVSGGLFFGLFTWGMVKTAYQYTVRRERVALDGLKPDFKGLKVVQISDLHLGSFTSTEPIERAVEMINDLEADVVFFTGDLVNSYYKEALPFIEALSKVKAKYGVFSSLGNHDYAHHYRRMNEEEGEEAMRNLIDVHRQFGWTLLNNDNRMIDIDGQQIAIIGVENWGKSHYFPKAGDVAKAKQGTENANARLLLSHDPSHWDEIVSKGHDDIDITFSGHTHGFQMGVEIPWLKIKWSPAQYSYPQWAGLYNKAKQYLYVNRGLGFIGYHGRVGMPPEITLMEVVGRA